MYWYHLQAILETIQFPNALKLLAVKKKCSVHHVVYLLKSSKKA
jgi:hypothetical protein